MEIAATLDSGGGLGLGKLRVTTERLVFERKKLFGGGSCRVLTRSVGNCRQQGAAVRLADAA